jgi:hypothetical protein
MITMEILTNYAFLHQLLVDAGLYPVSRDDIWITDDTVAVLVSEHLNQDVTNYVFDYTMDKLQNVVLQVNSRTLGVIGSFQCNKIEAMMIKLQRHVPDEFELRLRR